MGWVDLGMGISTLESSPFRPSASLPLHQMRPFRNSIIVAGEDVYRRPHPPNPPSPCTEKGGLFQSYHVVNKNDFPLPACGEGWAAAAKLGRVGVGSRSSQLNPRPSASIGGSKAVRFSPPCGRGGEQRATRKRCRRAGWGLAVRS